MLRLLMANWAIVLRRTPAASTAISAVRSLPALYARSDREQQAYALRQPTDDGTAAAAAGNDKLLALNYGCGGAALRASRLASG